ncbi:MAG: SufE family protein [Prosthecobacter sp.]|nr:SufE family protein [Prosthecobacter sp.]
MSLASKQQTLIEDLNHIPDAHERLGALSSFIPPVALPAELKTDDLLVPGCVSRVWLEGREQNGRLRFRCAADSPMVAGLVALLCHLYDDSDPAEAATVEPEIWTACGLTKVLSPTRLNGLSAVRQRMRALARSANQNIRGEAQAP